MNKDEQLKQMVDNFGRLSFLLETAIKLHQTGDSPEIKNLCFAHCLSAAERLAEQLDVFTAEVINHE